MRADDPGAHTHPMSTRTAAPTDKGIADRLAPKGPALPVAAGIAWLVAFATTVNDSLYDEEDWELPYLMLMLSLVVATTLTVVTVSTRTRRGSVASVVGIVVGVLTVAATVVGAWALPLWMGLLAVSLVLHAVADRARRGVLLTMAAVPVLAIGALIIGAEIGIGEKDKWGDYPQAGTLSMGVMAFGMAVTLGWFARATSR
jgi:hypothetical protein